MLQQCGCGLADVVQQSSIDEAPFPLPPWTLLIPTLDGETNIVRIPTDIGIKDIKIPDEVKFVSNFYTSYCIQE